MNYMMIFHLLFFSPHYWFLRQNKSWQCAPDMDRKISKRGSHFESSEWEGTSLWGRGSEKSPPSPHLFVSCPVLLPGNSNSWRCISVAEVTMQVPETLRYRNPSLSSEELWSRKFWGTTLLFFTSLSSCHMDTTKFSFRNHIAEWRE